MKVKRRNRKQGLKEGKEKDVSETITGKKTLVEAVQEGRQACVLKYLCGAAVVVYGVPVVLD